MIQNQLGYYKNDLYRNVYVKIYRGLTSVEQSFVNAMSESDSTDVAFGDIVKAMESRRTTYPHTV